MKETVLVINKQGEIGWNERFDWKTYCKQKGLLVEDEI